MSFVCYVFVFKQKTAYEMRISDWSSDVCSSDLREIRPIDADPGRPRDRGQVDGVIGRSAGRKQADDGVDDRLFIDAQAQWPIIVAIPTDMRQTVDSGAGKFAARSEEHTSELQSLMRLSYAVFCLKKKNTK